VKNEVVPSKNGMLSFLINTKNIDKEITKNYKVFHIYHNTEGWLTSYKGKEKNIGA
jgi:hypothetical protein